MFKAILRSRINIIHLLFVNIVSISLTFLIMYPVMMFIIWGVVGDGLYPKSYDFWINLIYSFSAIIILYPIIFLLLQKDYKSGKLAQAKSYLIASFVVLIGSGFITCSQKIWL
jgi:hypothetical protein